MTTQQVELSPSSLKALAELLKPEVKPDSTPSALDVLFLSIAGAARRQSVSTETIRRMIERGELKAHKFGKSIRIKITDLDRAAKPIKTVGDLMDGAAQ